MKKVSALIALLLLCVVFTTTQAQVILSMQPGAAHRHVPGTKVLIAPPDGFVKADFTGFENTEANAVLKLQQSSTPYTSTLRMYKAGYLTDGTAIEIKQTKDYLIKNLKGVLITGVERRNTDRSAYLLVFGSETESVVIEATYPTGNKTLEKNLLQSLFTVVYEQERVIGTFEAVDFTLDTTGTGYTFAQQENRLLFFIADNEPPGNENPENFFIAAQTHPRDTTGIDVKAKVLEELEDGPFGRMKTERIESITLDGLPGYAVTGTVNDEQNNITLNMYCIMLFGKRFYMLMGGTTTPQYMAGVKKAFSTFKLKD